jgi:5'-phosphate synthase pdxT subunit
MSRITIGVLALQGAFYEHIQLLKKASALLNQAQDQLATQWEFIEVRTPEQLDRCDALILPGGESTTISLVAVSSNLLEPLRDFVKYARIAFICINCGISACLLTPLAQTSSQTDVGHMRRLDSPR